MIGMPHRVARTARVAAGVLLVSAVLLACGEGGPYVPAGLVRTPAPYLGALSLPESTAGGVDFAFRVEGRTEGDPQESASLQ